MKEETLRLIEEISGILAIYSLIMYLMFFSGMTGAVIGGNYVKFFAILYIVKATIFGFLWLFLRKKRIHGKTIEKIVLDKKQELVEEIKEKI